ncbi:MAG TPA: hypothetical protein VGZ22_30605 [Isosphaeraceae bacterium]|nr:hypothetical protein [Isosphaeraceae bacterium]
MIEDCANPFAIAGDFLGNLLGRIGRKVAVKTQDARIDVARDVLKRQIAAAAEAGVSLSVDPDSPD